MANIYYESDVDRSFIASRKVAILGYGSQGHAHALNLKESGIDVRVGLREGSGSTKKAADAGLEVRSIPDAVAEADVIMMLMPDTEMGTIYAEHVEPNLAEGDALFFAHGFNIRFGLISPPDNVDVCMVAPKGPGHLVRRTFTEGGGVPCLIAVEQDAGGSAKQLALAYADAIGGARAGIIETTFTEETETDLFGEQAVLCGGVSALIRGGFDTLVKAGYQPEIAYFECLHELKLIVDLIYQGGLSYMWYSVSDTAEHGGYEGGEQIVTDDVKLRMQHLLEEIQNGTYARRWIDEDAGGRKEFSRRRSCEHRHQIEEVGARLRSMMPFLDAKKAPGREEAPQDRQVGMGVGDGDVPVGAATP